MDSSPSFKPVQSREADLSFLILSIYALVFTATRSERPPGTSRRSSREGRCMNDVTAQSWSSGSRMTPDAGISLGLGLTSECNLACAFCYRDPTRTDRLYLDQVKAVMERLPVRSVNLGTGENGMHPDFKAMLAYLRTKPVKLTITSNGHSVVVLEDDELRDFHDIEFSLDYATQ